MQDRPFDIIVFGATGFAGRLVAEYLQDHYGPEVRWAIAGRSERKLEAVVRELAERKPDAPAVAFRVADSMDRASLDALTAETKVMCTTVGPYAKFGVELVASCVANGTHYCDLTGEPQFVRRMIDAHHDDAVAKGVRIVHCSGFDSIPSDLGTRYLQQQAIDRDGLPCDEVEFVIRKIRGGFSGGTIASMVQVLNEAGDPAVRKVLGNPYSLAGGRGPDGQPQSGVRYSAAADAWTAPFVMAAVNEKVVRRSNVLLGHLYGESFRYAESMQVGRGTRGRLKAMGVAAGLGAFTAGMLVKPVRKVLLTRLPAPGEGPSREEVENGHFTARLYGKRGGEVVITVDVKGTRDPGYGATACMLAEAALLLTTDDAGEPGVCTPAVGLGLPLVDRLHSKLVQFAVVS